MNGINIVDFGMWVSTVIFGTEEHRYPYRWVKDGWMCSTDGHRAHLLKSDKKEGLLYPDSDDYVEKKSFNNYYPNSFDMYSKFDLKNVEYKQIKFGDIKRGFSSGFTRACLLNDRVFQYKFIFDAFWGADKMRFYFLDDNQCGVLESLDKTRKAFIMPFSRNNVFIDIDKGNKCGFCNWAFNGIDDINTYCLKHEEILIHEEDKACDDFVGME